jgi:transposase
VVGIVLSCLRFLLEELERLEGRKREIEKELENVVPNDSLIFTIPGIGKTLGCIILARVGDVRRFECGDSVVIKLQILGLTFSPIRLGLWSTSWCEYSYLLPSLLS